MIKLDVSKLLGFKICVSGTDAAKAGAKPSVGAMAGAKPAAKTGPAIGAKAGTKLARG